MGELSIALAVFAGLVAASFGMMFLSPLLPSHHRDEETNAVIRLVANIFVVMTSLVFGLMINSAKSTFESVDRNVHSYATDLILLDHAFRNYGLGGVEVRQGLAAYVEQAIDRPVRADDAFESEPDRAGQMLNALGDRITAIQPSDSYHERLLVDIRQQYRKLVEQRWIILEQSEGGIPMLLIGLLATWLVLIYASFGFRAPQNRMVAASFLVSSALIAGAFYLVLDMNVPFDGPIQISDAPLRRVLAEMRL